ncbi:MAG TPA: hypothetical protein VNX01_07170 [Bacteroidia bacterium]|jgi:hypothetical protein|nr:hypothetical protein [Bacteroidia bacterium]
MLSIRIKEKIEKEFGRGPIKYAKDCDVLASAIANKCNCKVSSSTLKRLFGINKSGTRSPRVFTLDLIANYIGYHTWDDIVRDITNADKNKPQPLQTLISKDLSKGAKFLIYFSPQSYIAIEYISKNRFKLILQNRTNLIVGDILEITKVETHVPLLIRKIIRNDIIHSETILGKISGVTEIKKYSNNLKSK